MLVVACVCSGHQKVHMDTCNHDRVSTYNLKNKRNPRCLWSHVCAVVTKRYIWTHAIMIVFQRTILKTNVRRRTTPCHKAVYQVPGTAVRTLPSKQGRLMMMLPSTRHSCEKTIAILGRWWHGGHRRPNGKGIR